MLNYDRAVLLHEIASELAGSGSDQYEVAEFGFKGIDNMTDDEIIECCRYHGVDYEVNQ